MLDFLKKHPFAVEAFFKHSVVLTFALPKAALESKIPFPLTLDTFNDTYAFVAVAMVQTQDLRPRGLPAFMGNDFVLFGYRIFVRYKNNQGRNLRGLYILKSETDKPKMTFFGNLFSEYKYQTTDISMVKNGSEVFVKSLASGISLRFSKGDEQTPLPINSPFSNWKEARRFAGPLPFTFTVNAAKRRVLIIEGVRTNWTPNPIAISYLKIDLNAALNIPNAVLANAFEIENVPYYWKKGKSETW